MKRTCYLLGMALFGLVWTIGLARGQPLDGIARAKEYVDQDVKRHRWELNVNAGNLFRLGHSGTHQYFYLIKWNSEHVENNRGHAWRFSLSPQLGNHDTMVPGDTSPQGSRVLNDYNFKPLFVIGHEWQRIYGRTMLFGGIDFAGVLNWSKGTAYDVPSPWEVGASGTSVIHYRRNIIRLASFLGAKIYLNHRISLSAESHIQFSRGIESYRSSFDDKFVARSKFTWKLMEPVPCYFIGLSYNI
ncbi:hypothetical protein [Dyadobacter fermentans]|uniref:Outer membrane protein beta-barrel domain-containing protein n=1 Tax=Dyadobacter fermentans (strain ATCC 700827 / DSM 18053 / CIP 107007 / KCTC 52180 / NS114) TaxID=471854 RepID=C6W4I4_DYAFD|nr:hypothetical protein [Dyadobacter fermentans]ACT94085.1 hypothetical protein Dfer_2870 [Dyadobacter fermentans DSM 18053]